MPGAPLRAMRLTTAGGNYLAVGKDGMPKHAVAKFGYDANTGNPYDNSVVTIDEFHNVLVDRIFPRQIRSLRRHLETASNMTLAAFTGTPVLDDGKLAVADLPTDLTAKTRSLMQVVQGRSPDALAGLAGIAKALGTSVVTADVLVGSKFREARSLEGFVCSYHGPLPGDTAQVLDNDTRLLCQQAVDGAVELTPVGAARYAKKCRETRKPHILATYTNLEAAATHMMRRPYLARSLKEPKEYTPKLYAVAREIIERSEKAVVLIKEKSGHKFFVSLLEHLRKKRGTVFGVLSSKEDISKFNDRGSNLRGEKYRVFVGETLECGEGTSFFNVRRLYLLDVPATATEFEQRVARVDRGDGHKGLPKHERTVKVEMACAVMPEVLKTPLGAWLWRELATAGVQCRSPAAWRDEVLKRHTRMIETLQQTFDVDPEDSDGLLELRDGLRRLDADADDSDVDVEVHKEEKTAINKLRLNRSFNHLKKLSDESLNKFVRRLCRTTVDEDLLEVLSQRCKAVQAAHRLLRDIAMDKHLLG